MEIQAENLSFRQVNQQIRGSGESQVNVYGCCGHRFLADGLSDKRVDVYGTPGNALGAYLNGASIYVHGNAQDAVGDTMNDGIISIDGMAGDAVGYAMRGGKIFVHGDIGYRAGIHMKEYREKQPLLIAGGRAGSFLGEYQAGGTIVVLGLHGDAQTPPVGNSCSVGMHGGRLYLRTRTLPADLPERLIVCEAGDEEMKPILPALKEFCELFSEDLDEVLACPFQLITPDSRNPYKQLYAAY